MTEPDVMFDVAIVGLGPVGAVLGCLLGREGLKVLALERNLTVYPEPRAAHVDGEIVRIFQKLGLAADIAPHIRPAPAYEFVNRAGSVLIHVPSAEQGTDGWFTHYMIYQPGLENALRRLLASMPNVEINLGATFTGFTQNDSNVQLSYSGGDTLKQAAAKVLIGCDGASSIVRKTAKIELDDYGFDEPWLVIDALVADGALLPTNCTQYCYPDRPITCTPLGPGRHRWEFMIVPGDDPATITQREQVEKLLAPWGGSANLRIERTAIYHFHGLVAREWRKGRILLAGDAAHQMPPFAGQGMCGGIRDAENVAWKVSSALASDKVGLLDTIQAEREPQVRGITEMAIEAGRIVCTTDTNVADARDRAAEERRARGEAAPSLGLPPLGKSFALRDDPTSGTIFPQFVSADRSRSDDVFGDGAWLIHNGGRSPSSGSVKAFETSDPRLTAFRGELETWLADHNVSAVLVRPDRVIFGVGDTDTLLNDWEAVVHQASKEAA